MTVDTQEIQDALRSILADPMQRSALLGGSLFGPEQQDLLDKHDAQLQSMLQDRSLGAVMNGPLWLSGASILNGTVTAGKISVTNLEAVQADTGTLNVTGNFTAAAAYPAVGQRIVINSTGLFGYNSTPAQTFKLGTDGSGFIGIGASQASWNAAGVLTIPAAAFGSITIADVSGGVFGGTYQTAATGAHINISTAGIVVYNATSEIAANETFKLDAATGAVTALGSFTIKSASSGARIEISNAGGVVGYNSGGTQTFLLNAATGAGQLGAGTNSISWDSSGNASIGGVALSGGKITASGLSVSTLSAITADMGTITAGSISAARITAGTFINGSTGTIAFGAADLSIASTGKLTWDSGASYIDSGGIVLSSNSNAADAITWKNGSNHGGWVSGDATGFYMGRLVSGTGASTYIEVGLEGTSGHFGPSDDTRGVFLTTTNTVLKKNNVNVELDGTDVIVNLADAAGSTTFKVKDNAGQVQFSISSNGAFAYPDADGTALGAYAGRMPWYVAGNLRYVPYYN